VSETGVEAGKPRWVLMGRVSGLYGLRGWVKVLSYTEERADIVDYDTLYVNLENRWQALKVEDGRPNSRGVVLKFAGYEDRDTAATLLQLDIAVPREQLPVLEPGEFYWTDLQGMRVNTVDGIELGEVSRLMGTGANDVMVVTGAQERLIPFLLDTVVTDVDMEQGVIQVDWDPDL
jgi:16S rRNA processing protein RimM